MFVNLFWFVGVKIAAILRIDGRMKSVEICEREKQWLKVIIMLFLTKTLFWVSSTSEFEWHIINAQ